LHKYEFETPLGNVIGMHFKSFLKKPALRSTSYKYIFDFFSLKTTFLITLQSQQVLNFFKTVECVLLSLNNLQTSLSFDCSSNLKIEQELTLSVTS